MIGTQISHYKIIEKLGEGGMGIVYKAEDTKLKRTVALKFLPPELTRDEEIKKRFIHEAQAASVLQHNNICTIHEIDGTNDGQMFICMDYYEGESLKKKLEGEKLFPIDEILDIAIQIAQGLTIAHESNIIHRDLKPANIMITDRGEVKIVDFGLAKLAGQTKLTKEGTTLGTIAYMSPEQSRGEEVDHRLDIWQLGVILYEMITGQHPFKGDYDQAVMYSITNEKPEPITGLRSGVSVELERIVNRMLAKDVQDRYQHVDDLLSELNRAKKDSDSKIVPIKPESPKKNVFILPTIILSIVVLIIVGYLLLKPTQHQKTKLPAAEWENSIAVLPFENISADPEQEYFCDGMTEQIITNLYKLNRLKVIGRTSVMKYKNTTKSLPEIGQELNVTHILEGSIRKYGKSIRVTAQLINTEDGSHLWAEDFDRELEHVFDIQDDVSTKIANRLLDKLSDEETIVIKTIRTENLEAYEYYLKGKHFHSKFWNTIVKKDILDSEKLLKKAISLDPNFSEAHAMLANMYNSYYNYYYGFADNEKERNKYMQLQEAYLDTAMQLNPNSSFVYHIKGNVHLAKVKNYYFYGEFDKCEPESEQSFNSYKKAIKISKNNDALYFDLGMFYYYTGLLDLAIKCYEKAKKLNPLRLMYYWWLGISYQNLGEYDKLEMIFKEALAIQPDNRQILQYHLGTQIAFGNIDKSQKLLSQLEKYYPEENYDFFNALIHALKNEKDIALSIYPQKSIWLSALLGMENQAIDLMEEDLKRHKIMKFVEVQKYELPLFDNIRSDPRFQEIVAEHKKIYQENLVKYGDIDL